MGGAGYMYVNQQRSKRNNDRGHGGGCGGNGGWGHELDACMSTSSIARGTMTEVMESWQQQWSGTPEPAVVVEMAMVNVMSDPSRVANQMELVEVTIPA
jgi:hypothetical protein